MKDQINKIIDELLVKDSHEEMRVIINSHQVDKENIFCYDCQKLFNYLVSLKTIINEIEDMELLRMALSDYRDSEDPKYYEIISKYTKQQV